MGTGIRLVLIKSLVTTMLAVAGTLGAFFTSRWLTGIPYGVINLVECTVIPIVVGFPISWFLHTQSKKLRQAHEQVLALHAETEKAHAQLRQAYEVIAFSSRHDRMTGVFNREHFLALLTSAYSAGEEAVFLMIDADHFKQINDTFGHAKGDEALIIIANSLQSVMRADDSVGRIGGEEFGVLLRGISIAAAADLAETIRLTVNSVDWTPTGKDAYRLSVSVGGAAFRDCPSGVTEVLLRADRCLYEAKASGRNRIAFNYNLSNFAYVRASRDILPRWKLAAG